MNSANPSSASPFPLAWLPFDQAWKIKFHRSKEQALEDLDNEQYKFNPKTDTQRTDDHFHPYLKGHRIKVEDNDTTLVGLCFEVSNTQNKSLSSTNSDFVKKRRFIQITSTYASLFLGMISAFGTLLCYQGAAKALAILLSASSISCFALALLNIFRVYAEHEANKKTEMPLAKQLAPLPDRIEDEVVRCKDQGFGYIYEKQRKVTQTELTWKERRVMPPDEVCLAALTSLKNNSANSEAAADAFFMRPNPLDNETRLSEEEGPTPFAYAFENPLNSNELYDIGKCLKPLTSSYQECKKAYTTFKSSLEKEKKEVTAFLQQERGRCDYQGFKKAISAIEEELLKNPLTLNPSVSAPHLATSEDEQSEEEPFKIVNINDSPSNQKLQEKSEELKAKEIEEREKNKIQEHKTLIENVAQGILTAAKTLEKEALSAINPKLNTYESNFKSKTETLFGQVYEQIKYFQNETRNPISTLLDLYESDKEQLRLQKKEDFLKRPHFEQIRSGAIEQISFEPTRMPKLPKVHNTWEDLIGAYFPPTEEHQKIHEIFKSKIKTPDQSANARPPRPSTSKRGQPPSPPLSPVPTPPQGIAKRDSTIGHLDKIVKQGSETWGK